MNALPVPDNGWPHLLRRAVAVAGLWAVAAFGLVAAALPQIDPQCYSDSPSGGKVCPLTRDPALNHLFDTRWPPIPEAWAVSVILLSMFLGIGLSLFLDTSELWSKSGGAPTAVGLVSGLLGTGLGLLVAGPSFVHPLLALGFIGLGAVLIMLGLLAVRGFRRALQRSHARHLRREHLRIRGTRTAGTITSLRWEQTHHDDDAIFTVTATFAAGAGTRAVTEDLCVPRQDAPLIGGTVIVIHDDQEHHRTGIDVLLEADPDSLRDPDALEKYPEAPESSPS